VKSARAEKFWLDLKWKLEDLDRFLSPVAIPAFVIAGIWIAWNIAVVMIAPVRYLPDADDSSILYRSEHRWFGNDEVTQLHARRDRESGTFVWMIRGRDGHWHRGLYELDY